MSLHSDLVGNGTLVLEPSTNTHTLKNIKQKTFKHKTHEGGLLEVEVEGGESVLVHGEHGSLKIPGTKLAKVNQVEVNPVTGALQRVFD